MAPYHAVVDHAVALLLVYHNFIEGYLPCYDQMSKLFSSSLSYRYKSN